MAYFVVEGNIGSGKSTFLDKVGRLLDAQLVCEPLDAWQNVAGENLLDAFYSDGKRWAYTFQSYAFVTRTVAQQEAAKKLTESFQLVERSVFTDRYCFAKNAFELGLMSQLEWNLYCNWFSWFVDSRVEKPAGFIYLRTDPQVCHQRLVKRNRSEEKSVSLEYLVLLHEKHEAWLIHQSDVEASVRDVPVLVLDCNESFESHEPLQRQHASKIAQFVQLHSGVPASQTFAEYAR